DSIPVVQHDDQNGDVAHYLDRKVNMPVAIEVAWKHGAGGKVAEVITGWGAKCAVPTAFEHIQTGRTARRRRVIAGSYQIEIPVSVNIDKADIGGRTVCCIPHRCPQRSPTLAEQNQGALVDYRTFGGGGAVGNDY